MTAHSAPFVPVAEARSPLPPLEIFLANPRGFCAGVVRAIEIVERALEIHGAPVYVRHEIVHNTHVVEQLREKGAVFVSEVDEIPEGAVTIFSAHGVSRTVERAADERHLDVIDATCPLVHKVHVQGRRHAENGYDVILIGHAGHAEVVVQDEARVAYITQTTLGLQDTREVIAALKARFPAILGPETRNICYATQNRQGAVMEMAGRAELILVIGSPSSSNSSRLREIGAQSGVPSRLVEGPEVIDMRWFDGVSRLGLSAGASAPEELIQATIAHLRQFRAVTLTELKGVEEDVVFRLPLRLTDPPA